MVTAAMVGVAMVSTAGAQVENGDYRVRADFRTHANGQWGASESVGNADFCVRSRFLQVYYGGARRVSAQLPSGDPWWRWVKEPRTSGTAAGL